MQNAPMKIGALFLFTEPASYDSIKIGLLFKTAYDEKAETDSGDFACNFKPQTKPRDA